MDSLAFHIGIAITCFQASTLALVNGAIEDTKDGMKLRVFIPGSFTPPEVEFELSNNGSEPIKYDDDSSNYRLRFTLLDKNGKKINFIRLWEDRSIPSLETGRHSTGIIPAGGKISYKLDLLQTYGPAWSSGVRLDAQWEPGTEPIASKGRDLTVSITLEARGNDLQVSAGPDTSSQKARGSAQDPNNPDQATLAQETPGSVKKETGLRWLWLGLGAIVAAIALVALKKRRSRS